MSTLPTDSNLDVSHLIDKSQLTDEERRNVATIETWGELYNTDVARMVQTCYHPDCIVDIKGFMQWQGHAPFMALEARVHQIAPLRRGVPERIIARGDTVVVQAAIINPAMGADWRTPFCAVLTLVDGLIIRDESYLDMTVWPSPLLAPHEFAQLGIVRHRSIVALALVALPSVALRKIGTARTAWLRRRA
jgi:ketosteroid isomerase-like protein